MDDEHESPLRRMIADARGTPYHGLTSLQEAQAHPDGVVILEGDDGGQISLTCPSSQVRCSEATLQQLLKDIDAREWNDLSGARLFYERMPVSATVAGGMGGGKVTDGVWVHDRLAEDQALTARITEVIKGSRDRSADKMVSPDVGLTGIPTEGGHPSHDHQLARYPGRVTTTSKNGGTNPI